MGSKCCKKAVGNVTRCKNFSFCRFFNFTVELGIQLQQNIQGKRSCVCCKFKNKMFHKLGTAFQYPPSWFWMYPSFRIDFFLQITFFSHVVKNMDFQVTTWLVYLTFSRLPTTRITLPSFNWTRLSRQNLKALLIFQVLDKNSIERAYTYKYTFLSSTSWYKVTLEISSWHDIALAFFGQIPFTPRAVKLHKPLQFTSRTLEILYCRDFLSSYPCVSKFRQCDIQLYSCVEPRKVT